MSFNITHIYRGDAVVYALVQVIDMRKGCKPYARVTLCGRDLPCGIYDAPQMLTKNTMLTGAIRQADARRDISDNYLFVLTYPLVENDVEVHLSLKNQYGTLAEKEKCIKLSEKKTKWASRYNYKYHGMEGAATRDIEKKCEVTQITTQPLRILQNEEVTLLIVKGFVEVPRTLERPSIVVYDKQGRECADLNVYLSAPQYYESRGHARARFTFSARVPLYSNYSCIAFYDPNKKVRPAFFSIESGYLHRIKEDFNLDDSFYRAQRIDRYQIWRLSDEMKGRHAYPAMPNGPKMSIVVPLYRTPKQFFIEMYESVLHQSYENWELVLVNASPEDKNLQSCLDEIHDARVKKITLDKNLSIADNTNAGVAAATGDYICLFDHDDILDLDVLSEYALAITHDPKIDVLYCDEDLYLAYDGCQTPQFKSDFNIDLLRCGNYITHLLCVRADLMKSTPERGEYDGAQDYDLMLRLSEKTKNIHHVPRMLYHWRVHENSTAQTSENKQYAIDAGVRALQSHMDRVGIKGCAANATRPCLYRMKFSFDTHPLVSIIIPNKDAHDYLKRCITSIEEKSTWNNFEIIIVENNSETLEVFDLYEKLESEYDNVHVVAYEGEFNYSKINNFAATIAHGEYLILLNNDTEVITPDWIEEMLGFCMREDVGAVGAKLLYPDDTIQHAGICLMSARGLAGVATPAHVYQHHERTYQGLSGRCQLSQNMMAVTAACMMVSARDYARVGGMSEEFAVAYNDIDFCLKLRECGLLVTYTPYTELYHHESVSRGTDSGWASHARRAQYERERGLLLCRWSDVLCEVDPYFGAGAQVII